jgi:hypothetical protein
MSSRRLPPLSLEAPVALLEVTSRGECRVVGLHIQTRSPHNRQALWLNDHSIPPKAESAGDDQAPRRRCARNLRKLKGLATRSKLPDIHSHAPTRTHAHARTNTHQQPHATPTRTRPDAHPHTHTPTPPERPPGANELVEQDRRRRLRWCGWCGCWRRGQLVVVGAGVPVACRSGCRCGCVSVHEGVLGATASALRTDAEQGSDRPLPDTKLM